VIRDESTTFHNAFTRRRSALENFSLYAHVAAYLDLISKPLDRV
jgi:hypothetical protein